MALLNTVHGRLNPLTTSEKYVYLISQVTPFNVQCIVNVAGDINLNCFIKTLGLLQQHHSHLRVSLSKQMPLQLIPSEKHIPYMIIHRENTQQWKTVAQEELNQFFTSETHPLCRVVLLKGESSTDIIFTLHHIIADGISVFYLADLFVKFYRASTATRVVPKVPIYLDRSLEELLPEVVSDDVFVEDVFKNKEESNRDGMASESNFPKKTNFVSHQCSRELTAAVIDFAKQNSFSVHSLLSAAAIVALKKHVLQEGGKENAAIQYLSPINLRPLLSCPVSGGELGHYVGCYFDKYELTSNSSIIALAKTIHPSLKSYIEAKEPIKYILSQEDLLKKYETPEDLVGAIQWKGPVVGVTNIGALPNIDNDCDLKIESLRVLNCMPAVWSHPYAYMLAALTYGGKLHLDLMHVFPTIKSAKAERFLHLFLETLKQSIFQQEMSYEKIAIR